MKYYLRLVIIITLLLVLYIDSKSQTNRYIVYLSDKSNNSFTLSNPSKFLSDRALNRRVTQSILLDTSDLPVSTKYVDSISKYPIHILSKSKWLNAVLIESLSTNDSIVPSLMGIDFISKVIKVATYTSDATKEITQIEETHNSIWKVWHEREYGASSFQIKQMNGDYLHDKGFSGKNMLVSVIDAGFNKANEMLCFNHLFDENRILSTKNFLNFNNSDVYSLSNHGTNVLSIMSGKIEGSYYGTSPDASYVLLVTEDIKSEQMVEEFNYAVSLEYADSIGVDVINASLGYFHFDNNFGNYDPEDLDGKTSIISVAANIATQKGILLVSSAGNEGASSWKYITFPSDSKNVLSVGAVTNNGERVPFSSIGYDKYAEIKPNVVALGRSVSIVNSKNEIISGSGTSYASPLVAGLATCLWQAFPDKTNFEIFEAIEKSSSQFYNPDYELGHGIPDFKIAYKLLEDVEIPGDSILKITIYPNPTSDFINISFHEKFEKININLYNILGKSIFKDEIDINGKINLSIPIRDLQISSSGLYFIKIDDGKTSFVEKILINP